MANERESSGNERKKFIKIITNSGYKYSGKLISQDNIFIKLEDRIQGIIKIPLSNISFIKEGEENEKVCD